MCLESASQEDISAVALLAPISGKQMHLSLFTISAIFALTTHRCQVIKSEEQFIFIAGNHSKHACGLSFFPSHTGRVAAEPDRSTLEISLGQSHKLIRLTKEDGRGYSDSFTISF